MKNLKLTIPGAETLDRSKLKNITGGVSAGPCGSWENAEFSTCFNCCLGFYQAQTDLPLGPGPYDVCNATCGGTPVVIHP
ncbi:hypothetical protein ACM46_15235 [Chryseobacterium angstadtii]|uniref:Uncharacterized protein n=1 Tax=Chryseobacterium angstadtii TaxID=558151 RepID=A0A0J7I6E3_9FLAO|nr:hypothetical protein [Chryseobacterium angstadtii]KMQ61381.1 hypothetical protein ACM46_15235 [Chryseobacterium angstadtii]